MGGRVKICMVLRDFKLWFQIRSVVVMLGVK